MKWGRKSSQQRSSSSPSSSGLSSIAQVFSIPWLSKTKHSSASLKTHVAKTTEKAKVNVNISPLYEEEEIDDDGEDDEYWRLSFGKESLDGRNSRNGVGSYWCDSDDDEFGSTCRSCRSISKEAGGGNEDKQRLQSFTNMVSDIRKTRKESNGRDREEIAPETPRRKVQKCRKVKVRRLRRMDHRRNSLDVCSDSGRDSMEVNRRSFEPKFVAVSDSRKSHYIPSANSTVRGLVTAGINQELAALNSKKPALEESDRKSEKESKIKEILSRQEKQRRSLSENREEQREMKLQSGKVRVFSPRTPLKVETCKIRALEDMKKAKAKRKKAKPTDLESYAMVKCSLDPLNDFRDSMMEMIEEHRMRRPEELEELLACYLTLNSDEYHDLIIKVFRQVWFGLNHPSFAGPEIEEQYCYSDY